MKKIRQYQALALIIFFVLCLQVICFAEEQLTITTYYPSPNGVYSTLRVYPDASFNPEAGITSCTNEGEMHYSGVSSDLFMCQKDPDTAGHPLRWRSVGTPGRTCYTMSGAGTYQFGPWQVGAWWDTFTTPYNVDPKNHHTAHLTFSGTISASTGNSLIVPAIMKGRVQYMRTNLSGGNDWLLWRTLDTDSVTATKELVMADLSVSLPCGIDWDNWSIQWCSYSLCSSCIPTLSATTESDEFGGEYTASVSAEYRYKFRVQGRYTGSQLGSGTIRVDDVELCFD